MKLAGLKDGTNGGDEQNSSDPSIQQQPEALNTFEAASRSGSIKPADDGLRAKSDMTSKRKDPAEKNKAATDVLKAGAEGHAGTDTAAEKASER
jgi:hypothetical protein